MLMFIMKVLKSHEGVGNICCFGSRLPFVVGVRISYIGAVMFCIDKKSQTYKINPPATF